MSGDELDALRLGPPDLTAKRLGVAVSGGSDSLALLYLLNERSPAHLFAVTVDHGLRPNSASEALHVERLCDGLGIQHSILAWQGWDGRGNLQDQARQNRYGLIADWAKALELDAVALGHTLDDQAETVLMRLARASGVDGLSGMPARFEANGVHFLRPLLGVSRAELRRLLDTLGVMWVEDPSNNDEVYERVKARRALEVLGTLGVSASTLAAVAGNLREARGALSWMASQWAEDHSRTISGDIVLGRTALASLPPELSRRLLAGALRWVSGSAYPPRRGAMAALREALGKGDAAPQSTLHGCVVMVSDMTVRVTREFAAVAKESAALNEVWDGRWRLDGPEAPDLRVRALGDAVQDCPDWRSTGMPRQSLLASPAVWRGDELVAAPLAGHANGWSAVLVETRDDFAASLLSH